MAFTIDPHAGVDLVSVTQTNPNSAGTNVPVFGPLGAQVFGSDGLVYVFAKANASIPASTAVCTVSPTTFLVTATGGAYTSPATAMTSGQYGWFSRAGV
jgi:hypothetical protein